MKYIKLFEAWMQPVLKFDMNGNYIEKYDCVGDAAKANGINRTDIPNMINGRRKQAGGFKWAYRYSYTSKQVDDIISGKTNLFNSPTIYNKSDEDIKRDNEFFNILLKNYKSGIYENFENKKYYKVVTKDFKSLGLRKNPNIMTFEVGVWKREKVKNINRSSADFGGIWVAQSLSGAKSLIKYLNKKAIKENKPDLKECKLFEVEIGEILYQNSYRVKTDKVKLIKQII